MPTRIILSALSLLVLLSTPTAAQRHGWTPPARTPLPRTEAIRNGPLVLVPTPRGVGIVQGPSNFPGPRARSGANLGWHFGPGVFLNVGYKATDAKRRLGRRSSNRILDFRSPVDPRITLGVSRADVLMFLGSPQTTLQNRRREMLIFPSMTVIIEDGVVAVIR